MARFGNGFTGRHVPTLGELRFSSMRREVYVHAVGCGKRTYLRSEKQNAGPHDPGEYPGQRPGPGLSV